MVTLDIGKLPLGLGLVNEWRHATYTMLLSCFNLGLLEVVSLPSQILIISFAFTNLILVSSYIANLAAALSLSGTASPGITSVTQLVSDTKVYAHGIYLARLAQNEHVRGGWPWGACMRSRLEGWDWLELQEWEAVCVCAFA
jgi:hypothetical protein